MINPQRLTIAVLASCFIAMSVPALAAKKKNSKPQGSMLIGIVEDHAQAAEEKAHFERAK